MTHKSPVNGCNRSCPVEVDWYLPCRGSGLDFLIRQSFFLSIFRFNLIPNVSSLFFHLFSSFFSLSLSPCPFLSSSLEASLGNRFLLQFRRLRAFGFPNVITQPDVIDDGSVLWKPGCNWPKYVLLQPGCDQFYSRHNFAGCNRRVGNILMDPGRRAELRPVLATRKCLE